MGSEMCIRDRYHRQRTACLHRALSRAVSVSQATHCLSSSSSVARCQCITGNALLVFIELCLALSVYHRQCTACLHLALSRAVSVSQATHRLSSSSSVLRCQCITGNTPLVYIELCLALSVYHRQRTACLHRALSCAVSVSQATHRLSTSSSVLHCHLHLPLAVPDACHLHCSSVSLCQCM